MSKSLYTLKHEQLLRDLKNIINGLLSTQVANVWSIYGGLNRLHSSMDKIFKHGCKLNDEVSRKLITFYNGNSSKIFLYSCVLLYECYQKK